MNKTRQNTPLPSTEITTTNQFSPLSHLLTPENIHEIVAEIHNTTPAKTNNRPTPTKGQNITSKINIYEDITKNTPTTPDNHPHINSKTHRPATHTQIDKTPHTATRPTQIHNNITTANTPHTNQHTKSTTQTHKTKDKKITPIILDDLKPQTDFNMTK